MKIIKILLVTLIILVTLVKMYAEYNIIVKKNDSECDC
jgi:hypothetical protein